MRKMTSILLVAAVSMIGLAVIMMCLFLLPTLANETVEMHPEVTYLRTPILLGMYATAIPFLYALYETIKMIYTIEQQSSLGTVIVQGLRRIQYCAIVIISLYVAGMTLLNVSNAFPPIIAVVGISIVITTVIVAAGAAFLKNVVNRIEQLVHTT